MTKISKKLVIENIWILARAQYAIFIICAGPNVHFRYIFSALLGEHDRPEDIETEELQNAHSHKLFYHIELRDPLQPERSVPVEVSHFIHKLTPHPKGIL